MSSRVFTCASGASRGRYSLMSNLNRKQKSMPGGMLSISAIVTGSTICRTQPPQVGERLLHALHHVRIGVLRREELSHDAEPRAAHAVLVEELQVAVGPLSLTGRGDRVGGIVTGDHVEDRHGVRHGPRHGAADVLVEEERHDPVAAGEAHRRADAHQARVRRGPADGVARCRCRGRRRRSSRRPPRRCRRSSRPSPDRARRGCACSRAAASSTVSIGSKANSAMLLLASMRAPASRSFLIWKRVRLGHRRPSARAIPPRSACRSSRSCPSRSGARSAAGRRDPTGRISRRAPSATFSASGLVTTIAFSAGPFLSYASMRSRYIWTSARHVSVLALNAAWMSAIVASS